MQQSSDIGVGKSYERSALSKFAVEQARQSLLNYARGVLEVVFRDRKPANQEVEKSYESPSLRKLRHEQAKLLLTGHASVGHQGAKELMELIFPEFNGSK